MRTQKSTSILIAFAVALPVSAANPPIRILLDLPPITLNPRMAFDASGQRLAALLYSGLTRLDATLDPHPDLALRWWPESQGRVWKFTLAPGRVDHGGRKIDAPRVLECVEQYRIGKPVSTVRAGFLGWKATHLVGRDTLVFTLDRGDPYFPRNASVLRYFTNAAGEPCREPGQDGAIGSGPYRSSDPSLAPEQRLDLLPVGHLGLPVSFLFVRDETTRALKLLKGEAVAAQNALSLAKTRWIERRHSDRFSVLERDGVSVSYLSFNTKDPILSRLAVRKAIALAIDRRAIVEHKLKGFGSVAQSLLSPLLPESHSVAIPYDPAEAERLLDEAGFPRKADGNRFELRYKTTPVREGFELALILREMLGRIGIQLRLEVVEPAVFLSSVRKGSFQLHSSRWVGIADASILYRTLHSNEKANRSGYSDAEMDHLLEAAVGEPDLSKRLPLVRAAQEKMARDLPYLPLWHWRVALIATRELAARIAPERLSLSASLHVLVEALQDAHRGLESRAALRSNGERDR